MKALRTAWQLLSAIALIWWTLSCIVGGFILDAPRSAIVIPIAAGIALYISVDLIARKLFNMYTRAKDIIATQPRTQAPDDIRRDAAA